MKVTHETPSDIVSYTYDIGKYALRNFLRRITETPDHILGAAVEQPLDTVDWPVTDYTDAEVARIATAFHEAEQEKREA